MDQSYTVKQKFVFFMMVKLSIYRTGMCIKGPESWWIAKSIAISRVVNQSKINLQLPLVGKYFFQTFFFSFCFCYSVKGVSDSLSATTSFSLLDLASF